MADRSGAMGESDPSGNAPGRQPDVQKVYTRLKPFGIPLEDIASALDETRRRERIRNSMAHRKEVGQASQVRTDASGSPGPDRGVDASSRVLDRLMDVKYQLVDVRAALALAAEKRDGQIDERTLSELMDRVNEIRHQVVDTKTGQAQLAATVEGKAGRTDLSELRDRLLDIRDQIIDTRGAVTVAAEKAEGGSDESVLFDLRDRLIEVREQIVDTKSAVALAAQGRSDEDACSDIAEALRITQERLRQVLWILAVGTGIVAPAVVVLLALAVWRAVAG